MQQITKKTDNGTEWVVGLAEWDNPELLADYLSQTQTGVYRVDGNNIWADDMALSEAVTLLTEDMKLASEHDDL
jgi:hypothetical protein